MYFYINVFLFYSIFGNMFERFITSIRHIDYTSGFMGTIFTPVYGVAMLVIIYIHNKIRINNKFFKILLEIIIVGRNYIWQVIKGIVFSVRKHLMI